MLLLDVSIWYVWWKGRNLGKIVYFTKSPQVRSVSEILLSSLSLIQSSRRKFSIFKFWSSISGKIFSSLSLLNSRERDLRVCSQGKRTKSSRVRSTRFAAAKNARFLADFWRSLHLREKTYRLKKELSVRHCYPHIFHWERFFNEVYPKKKCPPKRRYTPTGEKFVGKVLCPCHLEKLLLFVTVKEREFDLTSDRIM